MQDSLDGITVRCMCVSSTLNFLQCNTYDWRTVTHSSIGSMNGPMSSHEYLVFFFRQWVHVGESWRQILDAAMQMAATSDGWHFENEWSMRWKRKQNCCKDEERIHNDNDKTIFMYHSIQTLLGLWVLFRVGLNQIPDFLLESLPGFY